MGVPGKRWVLIPQQGASSQPVSPPHTVQKEQKELPQTLLRAHPKEVRTEQGSCPLHLAREQVSSLGYGWTIPEAQNMWSLSCGIHTRVFY